jgi:2-polyprenyl-3-methyl-5-hydroxy-6-metoxy-1,4-benzoquinol methylase
MTWYTSWFDSPYYELLYRQRDAAEARRFLQGLWPLLGLKPNARVWDMACGQGRHAAVLHELGANVWASDLSVNSINKARKAHPDIAFDVHDMRQAPPRNFLAVFNLFTSIGYFETAAEHQRVFDSAAAALCSGGLMVLDFLNAALVRTQPLLPQVHSLQGITFDVTKHLEASRIIKTIRIRDGNGRQEFTESVELLEKDELCAMAQNSNLQECYCFGDYDLQPFNGNASPRLILIFKSGL